MLTGTERYVQARSEPPMASGTTRLNINSFGLAPKGSKAIGELKQLVRRHGSNRAAKPY